MVEICLPRLRSKTSTVNRNPGVGYIAFDSRLVDRSYTAVSRELQRTEHQLPVNAEINVRPITQTDTGAVRALDLSIQGDDRSSTWDTYVERLLSIIELDWLQYPPWGCYVAEDESGLVGFLLAERQTTVYGLPPGARIVAMAVEPSKRRLGIGRRLLQALEWQARNEGIPQIYSVLLAEDDRDSTFLESAGFNASELKIYAKRV